MGEPAMSMSPRSSSIRIAVTPFKLLACATDADAARIQRQLLPADSVAKCDEVGICTCPVGSYFDGFHCKDYAGSAWQDQFSTLKKKWKEVPAIKESYGQDTDNDPMRGDINEADDGEVPDAGRAFSNNLLKKTDAELAEYWDTLRADDVFTMFHASIFTGQHL